MTNGGIVPFGRAANRSASYLRARRMELGLSRAQAAELAGCTAQTIGRYERQGVSGRVMFSHVARLCRAYGISADHLCLLMKQPAE